MTSATTVVIVAYNDAPGLAQCLEALAADPPDRTIVVDNSTLPEAAAGIRGATTRRGVELVVSGRNLGLAGGVNLVLDRIETPLLASLNPDTTPRPGWWKALADFLDDNLDVGVTCPLVLLTGSGRVNSLGQHVHVTGLGFNRLLGHSAAPTAPHQVSGLHGAAFVIRTGILRQIGGWDTTGFLYHEDVALSWSVRLAGWSIAAVPDAVVVHDYFLTMGPNKFYLLERNRWAMLLSHLRLLTRLIIGPALLATEILVFGMALIRGPQFISAKCRAFWWVIKNWSEIKSWRDRVNGFRTISDRRLLVATRWTIPLSQMITLGSERGAGSREPAP